MRRGKHFWLLVCIKAGNIETSLKFSQMLSHISVELISNSSETVFVLISL
jgi:hypothetical protein